MEDRSPVTVCFKDGRVTDGKTNRNYLLLSRPVTRSRLRDYIDSAVRGETFRDIPRGELCGINRHCCCRLGAFSLAACSEPTPGPIGEQRPAGPNGEQSPPGPQGAKGEQGIPGPQGPRPAIPPIRQRPCLRTAEAREPASQQTARSEMPARIAIQSPSRRLHGGRRVSSAACKSAVSRKPPAWRRQSAA
jgi:hypothetical protein